MQLLDSMKQYFGNSYLWLMRCPTELIALSMPVDAQLSKLCGRRHNFDVAVLYGKRQISCTGSHEV